MFGYVRICKEELNNDDYDRFRAYYCGLCKAIGKISGSARLGLSYDMTCLLVLLSAVLETEDEISPRRCMLHPGKKQNIIISNSVVEYVAGISVLLAYRKSEDDLRDEKTPKALAGYITHKKAFGKILNDFSDYDEKISENLKKLSVLEKEKCSDSDMVADCFAKICEVIFTPDFIKDAGTRTALAWLGYNMGRWIYLIDAFDDLEKDLGKAYNPFSDRIKNPKTDFLKLAGELEVTLTYTLANISAYTEIIIETIR